VSPWEELEWFDLPIDQVITVPAAGMEFVPAEVRRAILLFHNTDSAPIYLRPNLNRTGAAVTLGFPLVNYGYPLIITQAQWGPLAQMRWELNNADAVVSVSVYVLQVLLKGWPRAAREKNGRLAQGPEAPAQLAAYLAQGVLPFTRSPSSMPAPWPFAVVSKPS